MLKNLVFSALFAGFAAGLIAASLQIALVVPLVLEAELYETGMLIHFGDTSKPMPDITWEYDWGRNGLTVLFTSAVFIGFAFILLAAMALADLKGVEITTQRGLIWGAAGFTAIQLAPALGLPPELPGMIAAEVFPRQIWWWGTLSATTLGLAAIAFGKNWLHWGLGIVALALPHIIGAPHLGFFGGTVPPELAAQFAGRSLAVGAANWVILGGFCAYFWRKETANV